MVLGSPGGAELVIVCFVWVCGGWEATRLQFPQRSSRITCTKAGNRRWLKRPLWWDFMAWSHVAPRCFKKPPGRRGSNPEPSRLWPAHWFLFPKHTHQFCPHSLSAGQHLETVDTSVSNAIAKPEPYNWNETQNNAFEANKSIRFCPQLSQPLWSSHKHWPSASLKATQHSKPYPLNITLHLFIWF